MSVMKEFREFAMRGNVVDLAVGVIIGAAFSKIVSSLVSDIIMPPLGLLIGGVDFKQFHWVLREAHDNIAAVSVSINYGTFLQSIFDFILVTFAIFMAIKIMNKLRRVQQMEPNATPKLTAEGKLLTEIRDLLKDRAIKQSGNE